MADRLAKDKAAPLDELCALWIDQAPRFGAVAAHFPDSLRRRRFVASFWAWEVLLFGDFYLQGFTRLWCDEICALLVERAPGHIRRFWSPRLPEVVMSDDGGRLVGPWPDPAAVYWLGGA